MLCVEIILSRTEWDDLAESAKEKLVDAAINSSGGETAKLKKRKEQILAGMNHLILDEETGAWTLLPIVSQEEARITLSTVMVCVLNGMIGKSDGGFLIKALTLMTKSLDMTREKNKIQNNNRIGEEQGDYQTDAEALEEFKKLTEEAEARV